MTFFIDVDKPLDTTIIQTSYWKLEKEGNLYFIYFGESGDDRIEVTESEYKKILQRLRGSKVSNIYITTQGNVTFDCF